VARRRGEGLAGWAAGGAFTFLATYDSLQWRLAHSDVLHVPAIFVFSVVAVSL